MWHNEPWTTGRGSAQEATNMEPQTLTFTLEKETKNTIRYQEETEGKPPVVESLYVQRWALWKPVPRKLTVTIRADET